MLPLSEEQLSPALYKPAARVFILAIAAVANSRQLGDTCGQVTYLESWASSTSTVARTSASAE
jgi:hypothetical protein